MSAILGTYRNGKIVLDTAAPQDWKDGERLSIEQAPAPPKPVDEPYGLREEDWPTTPEGIAALLAKMDSVEGSWLSPEDEAEWKRARAEQKAWELANWDKHCKKIEDLFR